MLMDPSAFHPRLTARNPASAPLWPPVTAPPNYPATGLPDATRASRSPASLSCPALRAFYMTPAPPTYSSRPPRQLCLLGMYSFFYDLSAQLFHTVTLYRTWPSLVHGVFLHTAIPLLPGVRFFVPITAGCAAYTFYFPRPCIVYATQCKTNFRDGLSVRRGRRACWPSGMSFTPRILLYNRRAVCFPSSPPPVRCLVCRTV